MDFSQAFSDFLVRAGKSQAGFAREVGVTGPLINMIIKRKATPPMDRIEGWAEALGLTGDDRTVFLDLAALAHLPSEVQVRFIGQIIIVVNSLILIFRGCSDGRIMVLLSLVQALKEIWLLPM